MTNQEKSIFEELKGIRLEKKITLKQISQSTRIHLKYLESLEQGKLLEIPEIYDKLFFKSYLKSLDVSEADYYDKFIAFRKDLRDDRTAILDMTQTDSPVEHEFNYKNLLYFVPILLAVLIIWFLVSNTLTIEDGNNEPVKEVSVVDIAEKMQTRIDSIKNAQEEPKIDSTKTDKPGQLNLNISALERTWFRVISDGKDTTEYLLQKGEKISISSAKYFDFLIGKANGLKMTMGESTFGPFGNPGQVVKSMRVDSSGVVRKILGIPSNKNEIIQNENI